MRITTIMEILKFRKTILKIMKSHRIQLENQEHNENIRVPYKSNKNHKNRIIPCEDFENHEHITFHARTTKIMKI